MTPLLVVAGFLSLTEVVVGIAAGQTTGDVQNRLIIFVCVFPALIAAAFFFTLWKKPYVFYPPSDFGSAQDVGQYVQAMRGTAKQGEPTTSSPEKKETKIEAAKPPSETLAAQSALAQPESKHSTQEEKKTPKTADDLRNEMLAAFVDGKIEDGKHLYKELESAEKDAKKRKEYEAFYFLLLAMFAQDTEAFTELKTLVADQEIRPLVFFYIGMAYESSKDYEKAAEAFKSSTVNAPHYVLAKRFVRLAECYSNDGKTGLALEMLKSKLAEFTDADDLAKIYEGIAGVYQDLGNQELRALALEKAVELKPNDTDLRFRVAWAYSDKGRKKLALLHYSTLKNFKSEDKDMLNNLGVELERLDLTIRAVRNYKKAFELKESLAGANLAYQYMNAGFYAEAKETLEKAKALPDVHPNVGSAIAALSKMEEDEDKKVKELTKQGLEEQKFFKTFAESYFVNDSSSAVFAGQWVSEKGDQLTLTQSGNQISSEWIHGEKKNELTGEASNRGAKIKRKSGSAKVEIFSILGTKETSGYAYVSKDGKTMRWFEIDGEETSFINFTKQS